MKLGFTMIPNELFETNTWDQVNKSVLWCLIDLYRLKRNRNGGGPTLIIVFLKINLVKLNFPNHIKFSIA